MMANQTSETSNLPADLVDEVLMLSPHMKVVPITPDEVMLIHGLRSSITTQIYDDHNHGMLASAIEMFAQPVRVGDVLAKFGHHAEDLVGTIQQLKEQRWLIAPKTDPLTNYYQVLTKKPSSLSTARIVIIGAGPLGSRVAANLAPLRPAAIHLLDNRSSRDPAWATMFMRAAPGGSETEFAAITKRQLDQLGGPTRVTAPSLDWHDEEAIAALVKESDLVIVALERYQPRLLHIVNQACVAAKKPWLHMQLDGSTAIVGPLVVPGETACYWCFERSYEGSLSVRPAHLAYKDFMRDKESTNDGFCVTPPAVLDSVAGMCTQFATLFLIGADSPAVARTLFFDFERFFFDGQDVFKVPRCPCCGRNKVGVATG